MSKLLAKIYPSEDSIFGYIGPIVILFGAFVYLEQYLEFGYTINLLESVALFVPGILFLIIMHRHCTSIKFFDDGFVFYPSVWKGATKISYNNIEKVIYYKNGHPPAKTLKEDIHRAFFDRATTCMNTRPHYHIVINGKDYKMFDGNYTIQYGKLVCNKKREKTLNDVLTILSHKLGERWKDVYLVR